MTTSSSTTKVAISTSKPAVQLAPDGSLEIKDAVLAEIVKSGIAATNKPLSGGVQPMITISIS